MGISRDSVHKRRKTGGKQKPWRKSRKFELGRQPAMTKIAPRRVHMVRVRGGNFKRRALRLDSGNFAWGSESCTRKTRIISVAYCATDNEYVRTNILVKNSIVVIDAAPFRQWYEQHYGITLSRVSKKDGKKTSKKPTTDAKPADKKDTKPAAKDAKAAAKPADKKDAKDAKPAKDAKAAVKPAKDAKAAAKPADKKEAKPAKDAKAAAKPADKKDSKDAKTAKPSKDAKPAKDAVKPADPAKVARRAAHKAAKDKKTASARFLDSSLEDQLITGRIYAAISSRPGQVGRADGYILEGKELEFYKRKMQKKTSKKE